MDDDVMLRVRDLTMHFPIRRGLLGRVVGHVRAVNGISFDLHRGECLGLVGESGCGKSTVGRCLLRVYRPSGGEVLYRGEDGQVRDLVPMTKPELRGVRREVQMIFQDPNASLNPRMTVADIVGEPLLCHGVMDARQREQRVRELLGLVGLRPSHLQRYPHAFSGGQRQRIGIARALALEPRLVVGDEPVSALDVSVQAQVLNLLLELRRKLSLTYLFISHDLSVVRHLCDRIAVMYAGRIVEIGPTQEVLSNPRHPYTAALLSAVPVPNPRHRGRRVVLGGEVADPAALPSGCAFHPRCPHATSRCSSDESLVTVGVGDGHRVDCHRVHELGAQALAGVPAR